MGLRNGPEKTKFKSGPKIKVGFRMSKIGAKRACFRQNSGLWLILVDGGPDDNERGSEPAQIPKSSRVHILLKALLVRFFIQMLTSKIIPFFLNVTAFSKDFNI